MLAIIAFSVFLFVGLMVVSIYYGLVAESPLDRRLKSLVPNPGSQALRKPDKARGEPGKATKLLAAVGEYGFSRSDNSLAQRLSAAGIRSPNAARLFLGTRTLLSFGPALLILLPRISAGMPLTKSLLLAFFAWGIGHTAANNWLRWRRSRRVRQLQEALPDALDLMVVCLEAGLGLAATISRVGQERGASMNDPLGREFNQISAELQSGRPREEALRALGVRNGSEDLKSLAALVIQSDRLGASMAKTLRVHADLMRTKRRQRAEEQARKLPIKVLFPLALFLLPPLMVIVAGPALLGAAAVFKSLTG
jgi:tight adherence protein C